MIIELRIKGDFAAIIIITTFSYSYFNLSKLIGMYFSTRSDCEL